MPTAINYTKNYQDICSTLIDATYHPYKFSLKAKFRPNFTFKTNEINGTDNNIRDVVARLIEQIALMAGVDALNNLCETLKNNNDKTDDRKKLENFLESLYQLFQNFCVNLSAQENALEELKKHFSLTKKIEQYNKTSNPAAMSNVTQNDVFQLEWNKTQIRHRNAEALRAQLEAQYAELKKLKKLIHAFARANEFECQIVNNEKLKQAPTQTEKEKAQARIARKKIKSKLNITSFLVSLIVGLGEGLVAAVFAAATWPFMLALLTVGIGGFACNYYLFRGDSFTILKDLYFGKIFKDENGKPVSGKTKAFVYSTLIFSLSGGLCFGFLSFSSALIAFGKLFFGITAAAAIAAPPVGLAILAGFIGIVTAVALFTVFAYITANFARKDGFSKLIEKAKKTYKDFSKDWQEQETKKAQVKFIAKTILSAFIHVVFFALALAMSVVVILASNALFQHKTLTMLHRTFHMAAQLASKTADVIAIGLGAVSNTVFNTRGIFAVVNAAKHAVLALVHPVETAKAIQYFCHSVKNNAYRKVELIVTSIKRCFLFACIGLNGWGQSVGFATNPNSQRAVNTVIPGSGVLPAIQSSAFEASAGPNGLAGMAATRMTTSVQKTDEIKKLKISPLMNAGLFKCSRYNVREKKSENNLALIISATP